MGISNPKEEEDFLLQHLKETVPGRKQRTEEAVEPKKTADGILAQRQKTTKEMFEEFYGKPYADISQDDLGSGGELDWGEDIGSEILFRQEKQTP